MYFKILNYGQNLFSVIIQLAVEKPKENKYYDSLPDPGLQVSSNSGSLDRATVMQADLTWNYTYMSRTIINQ